MKLSPTQESALLYMLGHDFRQFAAHNDRSMNTMEILGMVRYFPYGQMMVGLAEVRGVWKLTPYGRKTAYDIARRNWNKAFNREPVDK